MAPRETDSVQVCEGLIREGKRFDLALADPPRTGAPGLAKWMKTLGVRRQVVDMFPRTHHVESVMSFELPA